MWFKIWVLGGSVGRSEVVKVVWGLLIWVECRVFYLFFFGLGFRGKKNFVDF